MYQQCQDDRGGVCPQSDQLRPEAKESTGLTEPAGDQRPDTDRGDPHQEMDDRHHRLVHTLEEADDHLAPLADHGEDGAEHQREHDERQDLCLGHRHEEVLRDETNDHLADQCSDRLRPLIEVVGEYR